MREDECGATFFFVIACGLFLRARKIPSAFVSTRLYRNDVCKRTSIEICHDPNRSREPHDFTFRFRLLITARMPPTRRRASLPRCCTPAGTCCLSCEADAGKDGCLHGGQGRRRDDLRPGERDLGGHLRLGAGECAAARSTCFPVHAWCVIFLFFFC